MDADAADARAFLKSGLVIRIRRHRLGLVDLGTDEIKQLSYFRSNTFTVGARSMPDLAAWIGNSTQVSGVPQRVEDQGMLDGMRRG